MSKSDMPITCLIRYKAVAGLQLSHICYLDTMPRAGCLCDCPICVTVAPAGGAAAAAPEGVRSHARRHLPLPPRGGRW
jgi:hypothetical protein